MISPAASCEAAGFFTWPSAAKRRRTAAAGFQPALHKNKGGYRWGKTHTYEDKKGKTAVFRLNYIDRKENMHKNEGDYFCERNWKNTGKIFASY